MMPTTLANGLTLLAGMCRVDVALRDGLARLPELN
jgi:hypothetical protein